MNFKAILGYAASLGGVLVSHGIGLPWWATLITSAIGTVAAHYAPAPGSESPQ